MLAIQGCNDEIKEELATANLALTDISNLIGSFPYCVNDVPIERRSDQCGKCSAHFRNHTGKEVVAHVKDLVYTKYCIDEIKGIKQIYGVQ
jgi:deoxyribodipyrimidine photolyase-like uncharacterized protein